MAQKRAEYWIVVTLIEIRIRRGHTASQRRINLEARASLKHHFLFWAFFLFET